MSTLTWITEKELEREIKKQRRRIFVGRKTRKFFNGGEKMRNARDHQGGL